MTSRVVQMRPVEKAAPALSDPVGGSVSCVVICLTHFRLEIIPCDTSDVTRK